MGNWGTEWEECGNGGGNVGNLGGNEGNRGGNAGNMGRNAGNRTEIEKTEMKVYKIQFSFCWNWKKKNEIRIVIKL